MEVASVPTLKSVAVKVAEQWAMAGGVWVLERDDFKDERACWCADGNGLG